MKYKVFYVYDGSGDLLMLVNAEDCYKAVACAKDDTDVGNYRDADEIQAEEACGLSYDDDRTCVIRVFKDDIQENE